MAHPQLQALNLPLSFTSPLPPSTSAIANSNQFASLQWYSQIWFPKN